MGITATGGFHQLVDDGPGRGLVRIAHPEVDNVLAGGPGLLLQVADDIENIGRKPFDPPKMIVHDALTLKGATAAQPRPEKRGKQY